MILISTGKKTFQSSLTKGAAASSSDEFPLTAFEKDFVLSSSEEHATSALSEDTFSPASSEKVSLTSSLGINEFSSQRDFHLGKRRRQDPSDCNRAENHEQKKLNLIASAVDKSCNLDTDPHCREQVSFSSISCTTRKINLRVSTRTAGVQKNNIQKVSPRIRLYPGLLRVGESGSKRCRESSARKYLYLSRSTIHGVGLFTRRNLRKETFIAEYTGETIRTVIADKREREYKEKGLENYFFALGNGMVVDATKKGGIGRFLNHSCSPNLISDLVTIHGEHRIHIFCKRNLAKGEELVLDYKLSTPNDSKEKSVCLCSSRNCKKFL